MVDRTGLTTGANYPSIILLYSVIILVRFCFNHISVRRLGPCIFQTVENGDSGIQRFEGVADTPLVGLPRKENFAEALLIIKSPN